MKRLFLVIIIFILSLSFAYSLRLEEDFLIDIPDMEIKRDSVNTFVNIEGFGSTLDFYEPALPTKSYYYEIPRDSVDVEVLLVSFESSEILDIYNLYETLPPVPGIKKEGYAYPEKNVGNENIEYPKNSYEYLGLKNLNGKNLIAIKVYPVSYDSVENKLTYITRYDFSISYDINIDDKSNKRNDNNKLLDDNIKAEDNDDKVHGQDKDVSLKNVKATEALASEIISNYGDVEDTDVGNDITIDDSGFIIGSSDVPSGTNVKYAIITKSNLSSALEPLRIWKTEKGVPAKIYTTEYIYANFAGSDNPEKIRNFLISLETSDDIDWVLLAGDVDSVPVRYAFILDGDDGNSTPTDYYYADLLGGYSPYDWDFDNDGLYADNEDNLDYLPEVYVGRIPTSNIVEMQNHVSRIINYEKAPQIGSWMNNAILAGGESSAETDEARLMDYVRADFLQGQMTYDRVYYRNDNFARDYSLTYANFQSRVGAGASLVNWAGHGSYTTAVASESGPTFVDRNLNPGNGNKKSFVYADSCNTGSFDYASGKSLGEDVVNDWAIGYIGASRVSWYAVGWSGPNVPYNQAHDYRFFEQMVGNGKKKPGQALYDSKVDYVNDFGVNVYSRKNLMAYNLIGEPELDIWQSIPSTNISVFVNMSFEPLINNSIPIQVRSGGSPQSGAKVVIFNDDDVYDVGFTDTNGIANFIIYTESIDNIKVTVLQEGFLPIQTDIESGVNFEVIPMGFMNNSFINPQSINFTFYINGSTSLSRCDLLIDDIAVDSTVVPILNDMNIIEWNSPEGGNHSWTVQCFTGGGFGNAKEYDDIIITMMNSFDGNSTDIENINDIENVTDLVIEKTTYGIINYTESLNLSGVDIDKYVRFGKNLIEVDSHNVPQLNKSAILTIRGVSLPNPVIMRNGEVCNDCVIISTGNDYVTFSVSQFSSYSVSGSTVDMISNGRYTGTLVAGNNLAEGGNVTLMNLTTDSSTTKWAGYFGNVTGNLQLGLGLDVLYDFTGAEAVVVYATQNDSFNFDDLEAGSAADIDTVWNFVAGNDRASVIFSGTTTTISGVTAPSVEIKPAGQNFNSTILDDGCNTLKSCFAFGVNIHDDSTCFDGSVCDFELMVPVDSLAVETYYFFIEMR